MPRIAYCPRLTISRAAVIYNVKRAWDSATHMCVALLYSFGNGFRCHSSSQPRTPKRRIGNCNNVNLSCFVSDSAAHACVCVYVRMYVRCSSASFFYLFTDSRVKNKKGFLRDEEGDCGEERSRGVHGNAATLAGRNRSEAELAGRCWTPPGSPCRCHSLRRVRRVLVVVVMCGM